MQQKKIAIAVTGASGAIYAKVLLQSLGKIHGVDISLVMSQNAMEIWQSELGDTAYEQFPVKRFSVMDFHAPFASGSSDTEALVICPCSMGTVGRIAGGISDSLITRAADVMLKERRKLICVVRETPYSLIQLRNMQTITEAGGIICPASPSFYSLPQTFEALAATVCDRVIDLLGIEHHPYRWGSES